MADPSPWPPIIGTLLGATLGGSLAWVTERGRWRRQQRIRWDESRRDAYGDLLAIAQAVRSAAVDVSQEWAEGAGTSPVSDAAVVVRDRLFRTIDNLNAAFARVELIGGDAVNDVANELFHSCGALASAAFGGGTTHDAAWTDANERLSAARDGFISAVRSELHR